MVNRVIILCTAWSEDYWETPREAPYPRRRYTELREWDNLARSCPVAGLGVYIKQRVSGEERDYRNRNFVYLKNGMRYDKRYDKNTEQPYFSFEPLGTSNVSSRKLLEQLPSLPLFSTIKTEELLHIFEILNEQPPQEWIELTKVERVAKSWRDYVGQRFLDLIDRSLSDTEFEDRVAELFKALGFKVIQFGHKVVGEYPDGEAFIDEDVVLVYDCKNVDEFMPNAEDRRKIEQYANDARSKYRNKEVYEVFVAKSFGGAQESYLFFP